LFKGIKIAMLIAGVIFLTAGILPGQAQAVVAPGDIGGHWAQGQIMSLLEQRIVAGFPDGSFRPEQPVTRAEYIAMINRTLNLSATAPVAYSDVEASDWFASEIAKAQAAGYLSGYSDGTVRPNNQIERQEMAAILARALKLSQAGSLELNCFTDAGSIPEWSAPSCAALVREGYLSGCPDGSFMPRGTSSRAMAAVVLGKACEKRATVYSGPGTYGPESGTLTIAGNVVVNSTGVILRNLIIEGNLIIASQVGLSGVVTQNVTVKGQTIVSGAPPVPGPSPGGGNGYLEAWLTDISIGGIKPCITGNHQCATLVFDVDMETEYTTGTAVLNRDVDFDIYSPLLAAEMAAKKGIADFHITGSLKQGDDPVALGLLLLDLYGHHTENSGVHGDTLIAYSPITITLASGKNQCVYTVIFQ